jgi:hypothetical protein
LVTVPFSKFRVKIKQCDCYILGYFVMERTM